MKVINFIIENYPYKDYDKTKDLLEKRYSKKKFEFIYPRYNPNYYGGKDNIGIYSEIYNILACINADLVMYKKQKLL